VQVLLRGGLERREGLEQRTVIGLEHVHPMLRRAIANMNSRLRASIEAASAPNSSLSRVWVPQSAGDFTPAGGGMYLPIALNTWPMKPSGVQLARPMLAAGLADAKHLGRGLVLVGREHHAEGRDHGVEARFGERQRLGVGLLELNAPAFGLGALAATIEQRPGHSRSR